jgi:hypothetical protein
MQKEELMALTVEDRLEMMELVYRYDQAIDLGDGETYADTFTEDGVFQITGTSEVSGRQALIDMVKRMGPRNDRHWVCNLVIDGDGDEATMKAYFALIRERGIAATGKYVNTMKKVTGKWRFARRQYTGDPRTDQQ